MAFPSSAGSKQDDLATAWNAIRSAAGLVKHRAQNLHAASLAGPIEAVEVVRFVEQLANSNDAFARYTVVPGLVAYVREQVNDPTVDVVAEYQTMLAQINATRDWVLANFPKDASGFLLYNTFAATGRIVQRTLTTAQTAGLRTVLTALIATID